MFDSPRTLILAALGLIELLRPASALDSRYGSVFMDEPAMRREIRKVGLPFPLTNNTSNIALTAKPKDFYLFAVYANKSGKLIFYGKTDAAVEFHEIGKAAPIMSIPVGDSKALIRAIKKLGLVDVPHYTSVKLSEGATLAATDQIGCTYPFQDSLEVKSPEGRAENYVTAKSWGEVSSGLAECHDGKMESIDYNFDDVIPLLYYLAPDSIYVGFFGVPALVRFDGKGLADLSRPKDGVVFAPVEAIRNMWEKAEGTSVALQPLVDASEKIIRSAAANQNVGSQEHFPVYDATDIRSGTPLVPQSDHGVWGYEVPEYGSDTKISNLYRRPNGGIVLGYNYRRAGEVLSDFFDTETGKPLYLDRERAIASKFGVEKSIIEELGLRRVEFEPMLAKRDATLVSTSRTAGTMCTWPFNNSIDIEKPGQPEKSIIVFQKLNKATFNTDERHCEDMHGTYKVRTRYKAEGGQFHDDGNGGFYLRPFESRFVIRFDANGDTKFTDKRGNIAILPAKAVFDLRGEAEASARAQQELVNKTEALVDHAIAGQSKPR